MASPRVRCRCSLARRASSARLRSVMSWATATMPVGRPASSAVRWAFHSSVRRWPARVSRTPSNPRVGPPAQSRSASARRPGGTRAAGTARRSSGPAPRPGRTPTPARRRRSTRSRGARGPGRRRRCRPSRSATGTAARWPAGRRSARSRSVVSTASTARTCRPATTNPWLVASTGNVGPVPPAVAGGEAADVGRGAERRDQSRSRAASAGHQGRSRPADQLRAGVPVLGDGGVVGHRDAAAWRRRRRRSAAGSARRSAGTAARGRPGRRRTGAGRSRRSA